MFYFASKLHFKLLTGFLLVLFCFSVNLFAHSDKPSDNEPAAPPRSEFPDPADTRKSEPKPSPTPTKPNTPEPAPPEENPKTFRSRTVENIARDETLGEDLEVRRAAVSALGARAGTVVVMEAQTGKILTIVNQDWAIRGSFKPCSTIKLVTAVAGLNEDLIDSEGNIRSESTRLKLNDALAYSNNGYFQAVGSGLGSARLIAYAKTLGLGQPTGINAGDEAIGRLPYGNENPRIYSHGDDFRVTPLQLAVLVSAVSNGGKVVIPQIPRSRVQRTSYRGMMRRTISLPQKKLQGVIPGMVGAAAYGTASKGVDAALGVAGKTGSCLEDGSWVGLFASVAPVADPQYAVIVITRGRGERGRHAAAVAGKVYEALGRRIQPSGNRNRAQQTPLILKPLSEPETARANNAQNRAPEQAAQTPAELFPPVVIEIKSATTRPRIVKNN